MRKETLIDFLLLLLWSKWRPADAIHTRTHTQLSSRCTVQYLVTVKGRWWWWWFVSSDVTVVLKKPHGHPLTVPLNRLFPGDAAAFLRIRAISITGASNMVMLDRALLRRSDVCSTVLRADDGASPWLFVCATSRLFLVTHRSRGQIKSKHSNTRTRTPMVRLQSSRCRGEFTAAAPFC